jgi:gliding motility-associated lipoprotein GldH
MAKNRYAFSIISLLMVMALTACKRQTVYNHYEHTPLSGWEKNDTLTFDVPAMTHDGRYVEEVGLRINGEYPFTRLCLIVEQTVHPSKETKSDTLYCRLIDQQGIAKGRGVSHYQYIFHLTTLELKKDDRLHIDIRHDMKREILPGISDIGIRLTQKE